MFTKTMQVNSIPKELKMNYDRILDKPFLVTTISWATTTAQDTELWRLPFPSSIMSNALVRVPFQASTFFDATMCCMLQVSGTPMHQGLIVVAALPHAVPKVVNINQILSAPHVFLNATESTSVCIECPMYTPTTLYKTQSNDAGPTNYVVTPSQYGTDVFDLVFFVVDPLVAAAGSSTSVSISVHHIFKRADFYVPKVTPMVWGPQCKDVLLSCCKVKSKSQVETECTCGNKSSGEYTAEALESLLDVPTMILDRTASGLKAVAGDIIDLGRSYIRKLTGFHNPNMSEINSRVITTTRNFTNNVDQPVLLEVLDSHAKYSRIYDDYYFRTEQDEMDLKYVLSKPVHVGKFHVSQSDPTGTMLFCLPITPMVEASVVNHVGNTSWYSLMRTIYESSRFWRGSLKLHIQAVCTNFHFTKMVVVKNYAATAGAIDSAAALAPQYNQIHNLLTDTLEFSAGGQIQTVSLPFCSTFKQLECTKDYAYNSVSHGIVSAYLVQPLVFNSNVPTSITFNVYISGGDDLEFSGYSIDSFDISGGVAPTYPGVPNFFKDFNGKYEIVGGKHTGRFLNKEEAEISRLSEIKRTLQTFKPDVYTVAKGDTLEHIIFITSNTKENLEKLNPELIKDGVFKPKVGSTVKFSPTWKQIFKADEPSTFISEGLDTVQGTETLVTPNSQDPLLNKEETDDDSCSMSFRPNKSIRDYLRRFHPMATIAKVPTTLNNTVAFDINQMLNKKGTNQDSMQAIISSYLGLSGGVKLKFKINGAAAASVCFVPPSSYTINHSYPQIYPMANTVPTDANSLTNFNTQIGYNPTVKHFTTPQIEMPENLRPYIRGGSNYASRDGHTFVLEMAIPNLNPNNYVFNSAKYYDNANTPDQENDLGTVFLSYVASTDGTSYNQVNIIPYIALNDEARLGYQVYNQKKTIPTFTTSTPAVVCRSSALRPSVLGTTMPAGIPINPMPMNGSTYFFN